MTLHVLIHRQTKGEPQEGRLRAWVIQEGVKGSELLKGASKNVQTAKETITRMMRKDCPGATLRFSVEDYATAKPSPEVTK